MKVPGSQVTVDSTGIRWCMMIWQWPFEIHPRLVIRQVCYQHSCRVIPVLVERFTSAGFIFIYVILHGQSTRIRRFSANQDRHIRRFQAAGPGECLKEGPESPEMPGSLASGRSSTRPTSPRLKLSRPPGTMGAKLVFGSPSGLWLVLPVLSKAGSTGISSLTVECSHPTRSLRVFAPY